MVDGHLNFDTRIDQKGFKNGIKSLGSGLDSIKGKILGVGAAIGLAFSGKEMIQAAASMKAAESQFEQTFGTLQDSASQAINKVASESGILEKRLQGTATSIYAFAKTSGMESTQALDMMSEALQVAADSAAYYDKSLEETSETLKSYLKGNYANDAALGLSSTEYTRNAKAMEMYGRSFKELSEAQKQLTLLQMVKDANALSGAEGQAAREAEGWENVTGNLKQAWTEFLSSVGTPVLAGAVNVVKKLTGVLQKLTETAKVTSSAIMNVFGLTESTAGSTADVAKDASDAAASYEDMAASAEEAQKANDKSLAGFDQINKLSEDTPAASAETPAAQTQTAQLGIDTAEADKSMSAFEKKLRKMLGNIRKYAGDVRKYFDTNFGGLLDSAIEGIAGEGQEFRATLGRVFSDLGTLAAPFRTYLENDFTPFLQARFKLMSDIVTGLMDTFNMVFSDLWDVAVFPFLQSFVNDGLPMITQFGTEVYTTLDTLFLDLKAIFDTFWTEAAVPVLGELATIWTDTVSILKKNWDIYGAPIFEGIRTALNNMKDLLLKIWQKWVKPVFDKAMAAADEIWKKHLAPLIDNITGFVGDVVKLSLDIYNKAIAPIIGWIVDKLAPIVTRIGGQIVDKVKSFIKLVLDVLNGFVTFLRGIFTGDTQKAWDGIKKIFSAVGTFFKERFESARDNIKAAFSFLAQWGKDRWEDIKRPFNTVGTWFSNKFKTAYTNVKNAFSSIGTWFKSKKDAVVNAFKNLPENLKEKFSDAWDKLKSVFSIENIKQVFGAVKDTIADIFSKIADLIKAPINTVIDGINTAFGFLNSLSIDIPHLDGSTTTWGFNIPEIPKLAKGMAVPANYGEFLAVLGDNKRETEVVSPVSEIENAVARAMSRFSGAAGGDINMTIELDGDVVYRKVVERNKAHVDSTGNNEFIY